MCVCDFVCLCVCVCVCVCVCAGGGGVMGLGLSRRCTLFFDFKFDCGRYRGNSSYYGLPAVRSVKKIERQSKLRPKRVKGYVIYVVSSICLMLLNPEIIYSEICYYMANNYNYDRLHNNGTSHHLVAVPVIIVTKPCK